MKKKALVLAMAACLMIGMVGCSKGKEAKTEQPATTAQEETKGTEEANADTTEEANADMTEEANTDATEEANEDMAEMVVTEGTFKSGEDEGEVKKATFTDEEGNDFIALINMETELPDEGLMEGKKYKVHHDNMAAMTDPQQFTNVTKIEVAE